MTTLQHAHGGTITAVTHIGHQTQRGVADWFFVGDVNWQDGSQSTGIQIGPGDLCHCNENAAKQEVHRLLALLNNYLAASGNWHDPVHKRDGRVVLWTPHQAHGRVEVPRVAAQPAACQWAECHETTDLQPAPGGGLLCQQHGTELAERRRFDAIESLPAKGAQVTLITSRRMQ